MKANAKPEFRLFRARSTVDGFLHKGQPLDGFEMNWFVWERETPIGPYGQLIENHEESFQDRDHFVRNLQWMNSSRRRKLSHLNIIYLQSLVWSVR